MKKGGRPPAHPLSIPSKHTHTHKAQYKRREWPKPPPPPTHPTNTRGTRQDNSHTKTPNHVLGAAIEVEGENVQRRAEELRQHGHGEGGGQVGVSVRHAVVRLKLVADRVLRTVWGGGGGWREGRNGWVGG